MKYNLHFYEKGKLKEIITDNIIMHGENGRFLSYAAPLSYDELRLFDDKNVYITTYEYVKRNKSKSVFKR